MFQPKQKFIIKKERTLKLYKENIKYIENLFKYDINNGAIKETNKFN